MERINPDIILFFRKSRPGGNFSIEASFRTSNAKFSEITGYVPKELELPLNSNGILSRIKLILFAWKNRGQVNHITGDVYFIVLGLPGKSTILTIHDCGFMRHPNRLRRFFLWLFWLLIPAWKSQFITVISEATKKDVIRYTRIHPNKIRVIPTVIQEHFAFQPKSFSTNCPRILHIGNAPNKNLDRHIEALVGINCVLHIIGKLHPEQVKRLKAFNITYENGFDLSDEEVRQAYEQSDLLLFASTLEGFGMPILEAQTVGRPVITSNCSSMPEVAGDGACLVDPFEVSSIRAGILWVIADADYREVLIANGRENVQRFSPATVAKQYAELYAEALNNRKEQVKS